MKTAEEILNQHQANGEYPSYYHESNVLEAMEEYASEAIKADREKVAKEAKVRIKDSSKLSQYQFESRLFDKDNYEINPESILNLPIELK